MIALFIGWSLFFLYCIFRFWHKRNPRASYSGVKSHLSSHLEVGVIIEETDIDDLKAAIAVTDNKDILTVYGNLMNGSLNHLAAFNSHIETLSAN